MMEFIRKGSATITDTDDNVHTPPVTISVWTEPITYRNSTMCYGTLRLIGTVDVQGYSPGCEPSQPITTTQ